MARGTTSCEYTALSHSVVIQIFMAYNAVVFLLLGMNSFMVISNVSFRDVLLKVHFLSFLSRYSLRTIPLPFSCCILLTIVAPTRSYGVE